MNVRWLRDSYSVYDDHKKTLTTGTVRFVFADDRCSPYIVYDDHCQQELVEMKTNSKYMRAASKARCIPYTSFHLANCWSLLTSYTEYNDHSRDAGELVFLWPAFAGDGSCIPNTIKSFRSSSRKSSWGHRIPYTMIFSEDSSGSMAASMTKSEMLQGFRWYSVYDVNSTRQLAG